MTIRDELDDARSDGYNDGFETGFRLAQQKILELLQHADGLNSEKPTLIELYDQIDQLSP